jgi:hypothetical protein
MNSTIQQIDNFHATKKVKLIFGSIEIVLAYLLFWRAFDTGSLWEYFFSLILFIGGVNNITRTVIGSKKKDAKPKSKKR